MLAAGSEALAEEPEAVADALATGVPLVSELAVPEPGREKVEGKGDITDINRSRGEGASRTCT